MLPSSTHTTRGKTCRRSLTTAPTLLASLNMGTTTHTSSFLARGGHRLEGRTRHGAAVPVFNRTPRATFHAYAAPVTLIKLLLLAAILVIGLLAFRGSQNRSTR